MTFETFQWLVACVFTKQNAIYGSLEEPHPNLENNPFVEVPTFHCCFIGRIGAMKKIQTFRFDAFMVHHPQENNKNIYTSWN